MIGIAAKLARARLTLVDRYRGKTRARAIRDGDRFVTTPPQRAGNPGLPRSGEVVDLDLLMEGRLGADEPCDCLECRGPGE